MVYATIRHRKENESSLYPARNFTDIVFNGKAVDCGKLNQLIKFVNENLQQLYQDELVSISSREAYLKRELRVFHTKKSGNGINARVLREELGQLRKRATLLKREQADDSEFRNHLYLTVLAMMDFELCGLYKYEDGTIVHSAQLDIDTESLILQIDLVKKSMAQSCDEERKSWTGKYIAETVSESADE